MLPRLSLLAFLVCACLLSASPKLAAQPLTIGAKVPTVDSCLAQWSVLPNPPDPGDSVCLGAKFWDLEGHLLFHIDTEKRLTKVDWSTYMPVARPEADSIAKNIGAKLGPCDRARNDQWIYWIWDNDEVHYLLGYNSGTLRLQEFEDQTALEACTLR